MIAPLTERALSTLKRFAERGAPAARCDLCAAAIAESHDHLLETEPRTLSCACPSCAMLFPSTEARRYRRVRSRALRLEDVRLGDDDFRALEVPVRLAFLCPSRAHGRVFATYPNAGGATESVVPAAAWAALIAAHPALAAIEPDVEGLLIDHLSGRSRCYLASVDVCSRLVGLLTSRRSLPGMPWAEAIRFLDGLPGGAHD